jgi:alpha-amylase
MFANVNYFHPDVRQDVLNWSIWATRTVGLSGLRLDASKHYSLRFQYELVQHLQSNFGKDFFIVGEYWKWDTNVLCKVIDAFKHRISLFDVQLMYNLHDISTGKNKDLGSVFKGALIEKRPRNAIVSISTSKSGGRVAISRPGLFASGATNLVTVLTF